ncbi:NTP hydrolase p-loop-containing [Desulfonema limicola]|uniref:NTP hydrolase p-loop-containing n=1 Tax=Desulfonema limicola TaxID=45656 RepID=A0A975B901_9BACT|nr:hypothetical protein [Desulfonema limicola]QTA81136.1 NTP hydrolase p-loop-containing [Desulfonema limicola]
MKTERSVSWVIKTLVPEEVYTDREEFLEYFYNAALEGAHRRTMSTVLLGQRRMGKTEIFKRVVNRLFFEQDPKSPDAVVPVYFSFPDIALDEKQFGKDYVENFLRYYTGFYTGQPEIITDNLRGERLFSKIEQSRSLYPFTRTLDLIMDLYEDIENGNSILPIRDALGMIRRVSDIDDTTIAVFLDEFQNTRLPQYNFDIVGFMQEAVESPTCPHFVTGSAMSILAREIIGRGALFGRFYGHDIKSMSAYWGTKLALNTARYYKVEVYETMAPVISERCGGNPFYITAVVHQASELNEPVLDENSLNKILAVDITSGFIWGELNDQVTKWISRINEYNITKWILYLSALDENTEHEKRGRLNIERIQQELMKREGKQVPLDTIRDVLIKLSRGDLLEYLELGGWFRRVKDPILLEFLKVWGRIEVEGQNHNLVRYDLETLYEKTLRKFHEYRGYLAEVHMSQVLINGQRKVLSASFFNAEEDIKMPSRFIFVKHRMRLGSGKGREIDVIGAAGSQVWVCQSKWVKEKKIGIAALKDLVSQADIVKQDLNPRMIRMWLFAHDGLTKDALSFAEKHGILWSARQEFDELLEYLGLRKLPDL